MTLLQSQAGFLAPLDVTLGKATFQQYASLQSQAGYLAPLDGATCTPSSTISLQSQAGFLAPLDAAVATGSSASTILQSQAGYLAPLDVAHQPVQPAASAYCNPKRDILPL